MKVLNVAAILSTLLAPALAGGPQVNSATVQLANDQTGAWASMEIPEDGHRRSVESLWCESAVADDGLVSATSAQLTAFQQDTACAIWQHEPEVHATLDAQRTWTSLAGGKVVELPRAYIACWAA